jgi:hypothetical protein
VELPTPDIGLALIGGKLVISFPLKISKLRERHWRLAATAALAQTRLSDNALKMEMKHRPTLFIHLLV